MNMMMMMMMMILRYLTQPNLDQDLVVLDEYLIIKLLCTEIAFIFVLGTSERAMPGKETERIGARTAFGCEKETHISATVLETQPVDTSYMPWWINPLTLDLTLRRLTTYIYIYIYICVVPHR
jgi:hypothetical protein